MFYRLSQWFERSTKAERGEEVVPSNLANPANFKIWIRAQPREVLVAISARAALRVLPALDSFNLSSRERRENILLCALGCMSVPWTDANYPKQRQYLAGSNRATASAASFFVGSSSPVDEPCHSGWRVAAAAKAACETVFVRDPAEAAMIAIEQAARAAYAADNVDRAPFEKISRPTVHDALMISSGHTVAQLILQPLWPNDPPKWFTVKWNNIKAHLLELGEDWDVWTRWFDARLDGKLPTEDLEVFRINAVAQFLRAQPDKINHLIKEEEDGSGIPRSIPAQGPGPHVEINLETGQIDRVPPSSLDHEGNNVARLKAQLPNLQRSVRNLTALLSPNEQPHLLAAAVRYSQAIERDISAIDFEMVYSEGLYLEEAAAAAERRITEQLTEPLSDAALAALQVVLRLHGPFILSSRAGIENLELSRNYEQRPDDERDARLAAIELSAKFKSHPEIFSADVARIFEHIANQPDSSIHPRRSIAFREGAAQNISIVVVAGAMIFAITAIGGLVFGVPGSVGGAALSYPVIKGLEKSKPFLEVSGLAKEGFDRLSEVDLREYAQKLSKIQFDQYASFVLRNEQLFRRLAGSRNSARWLHEHLDWLKEMTDQR
jgi:hypothetical protein